MKKIISAFLLVLIFGIGNAQSIDQQLVQAAYDGDEQLVKNLLAKGANPNTTDQNGYPPLIYACAYGYQGIAEALIKKRAKVADKYNEVYPMMAAVNNNNTKIIELLVKSGAYVNCKDKDGYTPLMLAAQEGYDASVLFLLKKGANVNAETKQGHTALSIAIQNGHTTTVKHLLNAKPRKNGYSNQAHSPYNTAKHLKKEKELKLLKNYGMKKTFGRPTFKIMAGIGGQAATHDMLGVYQIGLNESVYNFDLILYFSRNIDSAFKFVRTDNRTYNSLYNLGLNLSKNFGIIPTPIGKVGLFIDGFANSSYGRNDYLQKRKTQILYGAGGGLYLGGDMLMFKLGYDRVLTPTSRFATNRISFSAYIKFFTLNKSKAGYKYADKTLFMI